MEKIFKFIPQVYYDIIARIAPGSFGCMIYGLAYSKNLLFFEKLSDSANAFLFILSSYLIGLILDFLSEAVFSIFKLGDSELWKQISNIEEDDKSELTKMMAEKTLTRVLLFVFLILLIIFMVFNEGINKKFDDIHAKLIISILMICLLLCFTRLHLCIKERLSSLNKNKNITI